MKPLSFWIRRFIWVAGIATMVILGSKLLRGFALDQVITESFVWGLTTAAVFIGTRYYYARRGIACAMCRDTPEA